MSLISVVFLFRAIMKIYKVIKSKCAHKLDVNNGAITVHLVCFSLYLITNMFSITSTIFGVDWISSYKAKTSLFIICFVLSSCS